VTYPLETEFLGIPQQQMLRSTTKYAITAITLDFEEGTDIYWARQQVAERLAALRSALPPGTDGGLAPMSTPLSEMFMFTLDNPRLTLTERRELLDWVVRPALRTSRASRMSTFSAASCAACASSRMPGGWQRWA
jgi:cobalt-zinc-cadmium resistance protein CzcA